MADENKSTGWVALMLGLAVLYFGWGFMASDYFQNDPTGEASRTNFWVNTVTQLPNFTRVIGHGFRNQFWLVIVVGVAEVGVLILWGVMRKLERESWTK